MFSWIIVCNNYDLKVNFGTCIEPDLNTSALLLLNDVIVYTLQTMQHVLCTSLEDSPQKNPIIGRIECKAGHGAGRPTQKMVCTR